MKEIFYRLISVSLIAFAAYKVGYSHGKASVPKPVEKPPLTAEEKEHAYETVFGFYTIGCAEALEQVKKTLGTGGNVETYCKAATLYYRKRWDEANP